MLSCWVSLYACFDEDTVPNISPGAIGGPKWGVNAKVRPEPGLLTLRKTLGLYANKVARCCLGTGRYCTAMMNDITATMNQGRAQETQT